MTQRVTTLLLQLGMIAVALAVLPYKLFELDRYFVPKELVLHVVAVAVALLSLVRAGSLTQGLADRLLLVFLAWSAASALFATNYWLAQRALGVSVSSAIIFWAARRMGAAGSYRPLMAAASLATVCAAVGALAQAYGMQSNYFSLNRAPGGTFGNRNFVAHFCAICLPALMYWTATARRSGAVWAGYLGTGLVAAALVLSRSRAAWLAIAVSAAAIALPLLASTRYWAERAVGSRLARLALAGVVGVGLGIFVPNRLNWRSDSPYLDSARAMVDYSKGSGRGRLAQYQQSLRMSVANPVFGVGPGNWPVRYVRFAPASDPSIAGDGTTANPWPSSDWVAFVSERGIVAALALAGAFAALLLGACRRWSELDDSEEVLVKVAAVGTITATLVVSAFDAALLLAAPAFLAWAVIGAASGAGMVADARRPPRSRAWRAATFTALVCAAATSTVRSAMQTVAIVTVGTGGTRAGWNQAAAWDPGSYRINLRVAQLHASSGRCAAARTYARRATALLPNARAPRNVLSSCE